MNARLPVTAALALTFTVALGSPADAAVPACLSPSTVAPAIVTGTEGQAVRAQVTWANWCTDSSYYIVVAHLERKECDFIGGCHWVTMSDSFNNGLTYYGESRSVTSQAECVKGTNRYRLVYDAYNSAGASAGTGQSSEPELSCTNPGPPPPSTDPYCQKAGEVCRLITPPRAED